MFGEAVKRLDRLAPNYLQICGFVWEIQGAPRYPRGILGGFTKGVTNSNVWGSCQTARPIGTQFGTCLRIRLGMDIAKYNSPLNTTGGISGGVKGVIKLSLGKLPNGWTDWHQIRYTSVDSSGNGHRLKTIRPTIPHGGILGVLGSQQFKSLGNVVKRLDRLGINFAHYNAGDSGNGHRLNKLAP